MRARGPVRLPVVLTRDAVRAVVERLHGVLRLMAVLMYGGGLRLLECAQLRAKDGDLGANHLVVRQGKGPRDRLTVLPVAAREGLVRQLEAVRRQHAEDLRRGGGRVELPQALARKYPTAGREPGWQWVFPATRPYIDAVSGQRGRHHLHETVVQRAGKRAVREAGIVKPASCHSFRHSVATRVLEDGYDIRTVQELLGHRYVATTMIYTHVLNRGPAGVRSPADRVIGIDRAVAADPAGRVIRPRYLAGARKVTRGRRES